MENYENVMSESVGMIDLDEMEKYAVSGGSDGGIEPYGTPSIVWSVAKTSSAKCISAATALSTFATNFFSCGKFC